MTSSFEPPQQESVRLMLAAAQRGEAPEVQKFMNGGMSPSVANGVGQTGLHVACLWGNDKCVEALIKAGAQVFSSFIFASAANPLSVLIHL